MNTSIRKKALAVALLLASTSALAEDQRGLAALRLPEGFRAEVAAPSELSSYPMFMAFDDQRRLYIAEASGLNVKTKQMQAEPACMILLLEDTDKDGHYDTRKVFADKLVLPMGVQWYQGSLYVADPPRFLKLTDADGDGVAEQREELLSGWNVLNTASLHGPFLGPDGLMYLTHGRHGYKITTKEGETLEGKAARIWRCNPDGTKLDRMCGGGFDNPVEMIFLPSGETLGTMTYFMDPRNGQRDALMHWVEGGVYPKPNEVTDEFVRTGDLMPTMTKFARIAPSGLARYEGTAFGPEYRDNLFSAQFNPHRVQRHVVTRAGATFTTVDSDFVTSVDPDFHPTDVTEDGDGSLLVSDTGAWYVDACPLSRVAKPEVKGSIFRIVRDDAPKVDDAWGEAIPWGQQNAEQVVALLADPRPEVRTKARERLAIAGDQAVFALKGMVKHSTSAEPAAAALWLLHRINTPKARAEVRHALSSSHAEVRIAAARACGLAQDRKSGKALASLLLDDDLAVRRQAATALGQLGDDAASDALIAATHGTMPHFDPYVADKAATGGMLSRMSANSDPATRKVAAEFLEVLKADITNPIEDRFLEHALIYALIQLKPEKQLEAALRAPESSTRKAALIALDQLKSSLLTQDAFVPFLAEQEEGLRRAALWVASRHPEWSGAVVGEIDARLRAADFDAANAAPLRELVLAYVGSEDLQEVVTQQLADPALDDTRKLFVLDLIAAASINPLPDAWVKELGALLDSGSPVLRGRVAFVLRKRGVADFDAQLLALAADAAQSISLRLTALGAAVPRMKSVDAAQFAFVGEALAESHPPAERQAAAKIVADAPWSDAQLAQIATELLPTADALTFPSLLAAFARSKDDGVGAALVAGLTRASAMLERVPSQQLDLILGAFGDAVQASAKPLRARAEAEKEIRIAKLREIEPLLGTGDVGRGRRVFFGEKAACFTCHHVGEEGGVLGPDLTSVGAIRSSHDLLEAVLFPSASLVQDYDSYIIETAGLETFQGTIARQEADAVVLRTAATEEVRIPRDAITSMVLHPISMMPEGLDQGLTRDDLLDLMAFLKSLNGESWLQPERRDTDKH